MCYLWPWLGCYRLHLPQQWSGRQSLGSRYYQSLLPPPFLTPYLSSTRNINVDSSHSGMPSYNIPTQPGSHTSWQNDVSDEASDT